nr:hypothetical protein [Candidatus Woesebacteria bacterium]
MRFVSIIAKAVLVASFIFIGFVVFKTLQNNPSVTKDVQKESAVATPTTEYNSLASNGDVSVGGSLSVKGDAKVLG